MRLDNVQDLYPLSPTQEGILFHTLYSPEAGEYFRQLSCCLNGGLDAGLFAQAWQAAVDHHPILRTAFLSEEVDEPVQVVFRRAELPVELLDWRQLSAEEELAAYLAEDRRRGFDLSIAPLMRLALAQTGERSHCLIWSYHHLLLDGWSVSLLLEDVFKSYRALCAGGPLANTPRRPYRDYIAWLQKRDLGAAEVLWRDALRGFTAPTSLGPQRSAVDGGERRYGEERLALSEETSAALEALARDHRLTLNTLLQGAWGLLLSRYSGESDVVFGATVSGRPTDLSGFEEMVGLFINTLPVRMEIDPAKPLVSWLEELQTRQAEARHHEYTPLARIQGWSEVPRGTPLFESLLAFESYPVREVLQEEQGLTVQDLRYPDSTHYALTLIVAPGPKLSLLLLYDTSRFLPEDIRRRLVHLENLLAAMANAPERPVGDLPVLGEEERRQLFPWNEVGTLARQGSCLHERFAAVAAATPDALAVVGSGESLSYGELARRARRLAHTLKALGVGPEARVGLCLERTPRLVEGILGILAAGGAYVPLDPEHPAERQALMLRDARASLLLTEGSLRGRLPETEAHVVDLDQDLEEIVAGSTAGPCGGALPDSTAYLIYTSGSTGVPKGVLVSHANVSRLFAAAEAWFDFDRRDVWTLFHSSSFDFSVWEIWGALLYGGRLVVVPRPVSRSPEAFLDLVRSEGVTVLNQTPTAFRQLAQAEAGAVTAEMALRWVVFGGEALDLTGLRSWFERHGDRKPRLVNMYGITETTVHVTYRPLAAGEEAVGGPIGIPLPDLSIHLFDRSLMPVPPGCVGEIYVGGAGVTRGYLDRPELTAERFLPDPFCRQPGGRLYRTGDLARLSAGELVYMGRADHQVKVRGFRIELGEIEALLSRHPAVHQAVVLLREDEPGEKRLVAYLVAPGASLSTEDLRRHLEERLPGYMVPAAFVFLESLPMTGNGKLDRRALPVPGVERPRLEQGFVAPRRPEERILAEVWAEVLGLDRVGVRDNFFSLGGDSIRSIQVRSRAAERGVALSLQQLFEHPTIETLVQSIEISPEPEEGAAAPVELQPFELIPPGERSKLPVGVVDAYPLSRLQAGMVFHSELAPDSVAYHDIFSYHLRAPFDADALQVAAGLVIARHPILRTSFDLTGFSEPLQRVHESVDSPLEVEDLRNLDPGDREEAVSLWLREEGKRSFDWGKPPLIRWKIHRRSDDSFQFTLSFHHAILDGWSIASMLTEMFQLYLGLLGREPLPSAAPPAPGFQAFVRLEREALASEECQLFWSAKTADVDATFMPRWPRMTPPGTNASRRIAVPLPEGLSEGLHRLAREAGVPLKSVLLAAHLRVLASASGRTDVTTGLVTHGRPEGLGGEKVLGLFLNNLPLSVDLSGGTWLDLVREVFAAEQEMFPFRRYPLAELLRQRDSRTLFEVNFNFVHFHVYDGIQGLDDLEVLGGEAFEETNYPLTATFGVDAAQVELGLVYHDAEFPRAQIEAMGRLYIRVLSTMAADERGRYESLLLLAAEERHLLLEWNDTAVNDPGVCLHQLVSQQAARSADRVAVIWEGEQLSYGELDLLSDRLARYLLRLGMGDETPVGIYMERSPGMVVSILGVLKSGAPYVPLDPSYPAERLAFMAEDVGLRTVLTLDELPASLSGLGVRAVCLPREWPLIMAERGCRTQAGAAVGTLAYVIYTSGSTGRPKGVAVPHRAIANRLLWMQRAFPLGHEDRVLMKTPFSFDASIWELFVPLLAGAQVVLARPGGHRDTAYLAREVEERAVTVLQLVPSMLPLFLQEPRAGHLPSLRRLFCGGEALPLDAAERFLASAGAELCNLYGPTEAAIDVTFFPCRSGSGTGIAPLGRPIDNLQVHLLDLHLLPVPLGAPGELYAGGVGLARGYWGRPDLTAERFIPDPVGGEPGNRLYRTGDLARRHLDGVLEFLGRLDGQVKIRGVRVELAEIEELLRRHPQTRQAAVAVREDPSGGRRLVAYVVPQTGLSPESLVMESETSRLPEVWPCVGEYQIYDELLYYAMVKDERRNHLYRRAIERLVKDKVVLDIGTGREAIWARYCAEAGARKVYAVEILEDACAEAAALVERSGLEDRLVVIHGDSTQIELPEQVDICVSNLIGTIGGSEGAAILLENARRFLAPDGAMIPRRCTTRIAALALPDELRERPAFPLVAAHYVDKIFDKIGRPFDLRLCLRHLPRESVVSTSTVFEDLDFTAPAAEFERAGTLRIEKEALIDGFVLWLNLELDEDEVLDNLRDEHSWLPVFLPAFDQAVRVLPGDEIELMVSSRLCTDGIHPDYLLRGHLLRQEGSKISFSCESPFVASTFRGSGFHRELFSGNGLRAVEGEGGAGSLERELRAYLAAHLPEAMRPTAFVVLSSLPLTPGGKLDRNALPEPEIERRTSRDARSPRTPVEQALAGIWAEVLGFEQVGVDESFFELGGHSLLALQVVARVRNTFSVELPLARIFDEPTVERLSATLVELMMERIEELPEDEVERLLASLESA